MIKNIICYMMKKIIGINYKFKEILINMINMINNYFIIILKIFLLLLNTIIFKYIKTK